MSAIRVRRTRVSPLGLGRDGVNQMFIIGSRSRDF